jgi:hypothetical protein
MSIERKLGLVGMSAGGQSQARLKHLSLSKKYRLPWLGHWKRIGQGAWIRFALSFS